MVDVQVVKVRLGHNTHVQTALIRAHLAMLYEALGNHKDALPLHVAVLKYFPFVGAMVLVLPPMKSRS